ncbi:hypothetical protein [Xanthobacter agilis]|uniref:hypothetical protein n=1 Tax=Xanthobacter agilis TaxID=47492 RepID=UPI00372922DE
MTQVAGAARIVCPVDVFAAREQEIRTFTVGLNHAASRPEKVAFAARLEAAAEELLACKDRRADDLNCRLCQDFSRLRANTAALILRATRLAC